MHKRILLSSPGLLFSGPHPLSHLCFFSVPKVQDWPYNPRGNCGVLCRNSQSLFPEKRYNGDAFRVTRKAKLPLKAISAQRETLFDR